MPTHVIYFLFICDLLNYAFNSSDCITLSDRVFSEYGMGERDEGLLSRVI